MDARAAESSLCAAIRGVPDVWRDLVDPSAQSAFLVAAARHRVRPLVVWRLRETGELPRWPAPIRHALAAAERAEAALEIVRRRELSQLLRGLAAENIPVVVIKGAALAYSHYPEPWLRPREDTDLLVRSPDATHASDVLVAAGYQPAPMQSGELVNHQRLHLRTTPSGIRHDCDLHWKIANPAAFADLLSFEDLLEGAASVSLEDGQSARIPSRVHALLIACWHRVSHHHDSDDLLWIYDLHVLANRISGADAAELVRGARRTETGEICARGLRAAAERFDTRLPDSLLADLESSSGAGASMPALYLKPGSRKVDLLVADLKALPDWRSRLRLVREHLFPPADYMLSAFGRSNRALLPVLYLWRIVRGAAGWFKRP